MAEKNAGESGNGWKDVIAQLDVLADEKVTVKNRREIESRLLMLGTRARTLAVRDAVRVLADPTSTESMTLRAGHMVRLAGAKTRGISRDDGTTETPPTTGQRVPRGESR